MQPSNVMTILAQLRLVDLSPDMFYNTQYSKASGGFSEVLRGIYSRNGELKPVAIKRLRFHVRSMEHKHLFNREICVWEKLLHENVLPLMGFAFCPFTGLPVLVSEWMDNGTAWMYINKHPELTLVRIRDLIRDIAQGLSYLHDQKVVHSDLKADNVVVSPGGRALICDFGCTRMEDVCSQSIMALTSTEKGTLQFWAPELVRDSEECHASKHSKKTDVWALGMTIYEIVSCKRPYHGLSQIQAALRILKGEVPVVREIPWMFPSQDLTPRLLEDLCQECLARDPKARPSMQQILSHRVLLEIMPII